MAMNFRSRLTSKLTVDFKLKKPHSVSLFKDLKREDGRRSVAASDGKQIGRTDDGGYCSFSS